MAARRARACVDLALGVALALALLALYRACFQVRLYGDGSLLVQILSEHPDGRGAWYHTLYMPAAAWLGRMRPELAAADVLRLLSSLCGALGAAFTFGIARRFGLSRPRALVAALLLATSPAWWFFSTTIEVHTLHGACVALCALVALAAPWRMPALAAVVAAAPLALIFPSHQSGLLLGAGFAGLAQVARRARGLPTLGRRAIVLGVAPLVLAGLAAGVLLSARRQSGDVRQLLLDTGEMLGGFRRGFSFAALWQGWVLPLGLLAPLAAASLWHRHWDRWSAGAALAFALPSLAFFLAWGLPERGGYTLGCSMFLAVLAARGLRGDRTTWLALLALQLGLSVGLQRAWDSPGWRSTLAERADAVAAALEHGGAVISFNTTMNYLEAFVPGVRELDLVPELAGAVRRKDSPQAFVSVVRPRIEALLAGRERAVVLDTSYREFLARKSPVALPYALALEAWLAADYGLTPVAGHAERLQRVGP